MLLGLFWWVQTLVTQPDVQKRLLIVDVKVFEAALWLTHTHTHQRVLFHQTQMNMQLSYYLFGGIVQQLKSLQPARFTFYLSLKRGNLAFSHTHTDKVKEPGLPGWL